MTTPAELQRLIDLSLADPRHEPEFLRALLDAQLFVHLPLTDDSTRLRLVCFTRPDGITVIPVFTDAGKAEVAAQGAVRIGTVRGRELFMSAPSATFMLDPNDISTTIYPEEIQTLLAGCEAAIAPTVIPQGPVSVAPASPEDRWIGELVLEAVRAIKGVQAIHLVQAHVAGALDPTGLLVVVAVPRAWSERTARAVAAALKTSPRAPRLPVELTTYDPAKPPEWVAESGLGALWTHTCGRAH